MLQTKEIPAVLIRWIDAYGATSEWEDTDDAKEKSTCEIWSFGFLIHECEERLVIAPHMESKIERCVTGVMVIPASCVIEKRPLDLIVGLSK